MPLATSNNGNVLQHLDTLDYPIFWAARPLQSRNPLPDSQPAPRSTSASASQPSLLYIRHIIASHFTCRRNRSENHPETFKKRYEGCKHDAGPPTYAGKQASELPSKHGRFPEKMD
jgi:hypothetical protein